MQTIKLIVAGGRDFKNYEVAEQAIEMVRTTYAQQELIILSGMAKGADSCGWSYAKIHNVPVMEFPAKWDSYGKSAGYRRNTEMAKEADALLVFWDGVSKGTKHMIDIMQALGKQIYTVTY